MYKYCTIFLLFGFWISGFLLYRFNSILMLGSPDYPNKSQRLPPLQQEPGSALAPPAKQTSPKLILLWDIFKQGNGSSKFLPGKLKKDSRLVILDREAALYDRHRKRYRELVTKKRLINWIMTYHTSSDILYSHTSFKAKNASEFRPFRYHLMDYNSQTMKNYLKRLHSNETLKISNSQKLLFKRPKLIAWMSSHCATKSKRELYIKDFKKFFQVDIYGKCGNLSCGSYSKSNGWCWDNVLVPNYLFYFSMENSFCDEYFTEKLFYPLKYGLVPVVFGGANYSRFLPPHSYINAMEYAPKDLGNLLLKIQRNPEEYRRYHLWRDFWVIDRGQPFCELCHKLHVEQNLKTYKNILQWRDQVENCTSEGYPKLPRLY